MPYLRHSLQRYFLDQQQAVEQTVHAMNTFMAQQMRPVPIFFRTRARLQANISIDHNLGYMDAVKTVSKAAVIVARPLEARFSISVSSFARDTSEQSLSLSCTTTARFTPTLTQENPIIYYLESKPTRIYALTTAVALTARLTLPSRLCVRLRVEAPLRYKSRVCLKVAYKLSQETLLRSSFKHGTKTVAVATQEHGLAYASTIKERSAYALTTGESLTATFKRKACLRARIQSEARLRTCFKRKAVLNIALTSDQLLIKKSRTTARFIANPTVSYGMNYRGKATIRFKTSLTTDTVLIKKSRITHQLIVNITQRHALSLPVRVSARLDVPLKVNTPLKAVFNRTHRFFAPLQVGAPLKIRLPVNADLRAGVSQVSFLRARFVVTAGIFARLVQANPSTVRLLARQIVRLPVIQGQPCKMIATHNHRFLTTLRQEQKLAIKYQHAPNLLARPFMVYEQEAYDLFARMNPIPVYAQRVLYNNYIKALKSAGVWALMDYLYILAALSTTNANLNWVSTTKYPATLINSPTFTPNKGYTFGSLLSLSALDSGLNPTTGVHFYSQNSAHLYVRTLTNAAVLNTMDAGNQNGYINSKAGSNLAVAALNSVASNWSTTDAGAGSFGISRNNNANFDGFTKNTGPTTMISPSIGPANANLLVGGGLSVISNRQVAAASAGAGLTTVQMQTFIAQTESLLSALGAV